MDNEYTLPIAGQLLNQSKRGDVFNFACNFCGKEVTRSRMRLRQIILRNQQAVCCSLRCTTQLNKQRAGFVIVEKICCNCKNTFKRVNANKNKPTYDRFCSQSCSASFNNRHKRYGTRRSKLEAYIENQIRVEYPCIKLECNSKTAIQSELDFYFPELHFAIEMNGIFHYEPIYGTAKLEQIQDNDQQKFRACHHAGIELCVINASGCKRNTQAYFDRYWEVARSILDQVIQKWSLQ